MSVQEKIKKHKSYILPAIGALAGALAYAAYSGDTSAWEATYVALCTGAGAHIGAYAKDVLSSDATPQYTTKPAPAAKA